MRLKIGLNFKLILLLLFLINNILAQEISIELNTKSGILKGTLSLSDTNKKQPVVLIIAGSGATDRDGNNPTMKNNSLKMLANELMMNGIASVCFDKRGVAASASAGNKEEDLRFETYIDDVNDWINLLAEDKRFSKIIIAGHSEGSMIGMIAASKSKKVKKFISIAGPGSPADEILKDQLGKQPKMVQDMIFPKIDSLKKGFLLGPVNPMLNTLFRQSVQPYLISWFKYDPAIEMAKLRIPVLILNGSNDIQVSENEAIKLLKARPNATMHIIKNMNHVLKNIDTLNLNEQMKTYNNPELPINKELVLEIVNFIKK